MLHQSGVALLAVGILRTNLLIDMGKDVELSISQVSQLSRVALYSVSSGITIWMH